MDNIMHKVSALGGTISTTDIPDTSEYKRLLRAKERGDLIKLRHGIYAVPDALLNTMIDVERIVPNGIICLYNACIIGKRRTWSLALWMLIFPETMFALPIWSEVFVML